MHAAGLMTTRLGIWSISEIISNSWIDWIPLKKSVMETLSFLTTLINEFKRENVLKEKPGEANYSLGLIREGEWSEFIA